MIVVRNTFHLKYGKAKEALALWKEASTRFTTMGNAPDRMLTDLTGTSYTLVVEFRYESLAEFEQKIASVFSNPDWAGWYERFVPLTRSGSREILTVVGA